MALRAGYYGVKKSVLRVIEGLSGAKIIKTIGNGLKLTSAGTLSADLDADTMEFKNGKIASKAGGLELITESSTFITEYDMSDYLENYTYLGIVGTFNIGTEAREFFLIPMSVFITLTEGTNTGKHWICGMNPHADQWIRIYNDDGILKVFGSTAVGIVAIYGIK